MKISTNWLRDFVTLAPPIERIAERLTMAGLEVKKIEPAPEQKDIVFEIEITSNRPDWLSHLGVAREIAAVENVSLKLPVIDIAANRVMPPGWKVNLKDAEGCPYYSGVLIEGIHWAPTPDFIKDRLIVCGLRSINLIVDITNYVLLEVGQPLHAFDADLLRGHEIQIRRAKSGETLTAIDQTVIKLGVQDLVIADREQPLALAGIMGGEESEVSERTRNLFLESAFFNPRWVRTTSRCVGISSESSYRFERRVDPEGVDLGRQLAVSLIQQYANPRFISGVLKAGEKPATSKNRIHVNTAGVSKVIGVEIKPSEISSILTRLGLEVKTESPTSCSAMVPSFRSDLLRPIDLVEEIARIYGYDQIPETLPEQSLLAVADYPRLKLEQKTRRLLSSLGFYESVTFSLISNAGLDLPKDWPHAVEVVNPQNQDLTWMRPVMVPSLLNVIKKNANVGAKRVPVFEIANIYRRPQKGKHPEEECVVALGLSGLYRIKNWAETERESTFYDLKGVIESFLSGMGIGSVKFSGKEHPLCAGKISQQILVAEAEIGFFGLIHPHLQKLWGLEQPVYFAQISLDRLVPLLRIQKTIADLPRFPGVERDISVIVSDAIEAARIEEEIWKLGGPILGKIEVFDLFRGGRVPKGHKNLAFRLTYQSAERTLVSEDVQKLHAEIAEALVKKFQVSFQ